MQNNKEKYTEKIKRYLHAGIPILYIESFEEYRIYQILLDAIRDWNYSIIEYNSRGIFCDGSKEKDNKDLSRVLSLFISSDKSNEFYNPNHKLLLIKDAVKRLDDPAVIGALKYFVEAIISGKYDTRIVIVSSVVSIPKELEHLITLVSMKYPSREEIKSIIDDFCNENDTSPTDLLKIKLINSMKGMTSFDIQNTLSLAFLTNGKLTEDSLKVVIEQKKQSLQKSGILEMIDVPDDLYEKVGGLNNIKRYLERKNVILQNIDDAESFKIEPPKGFLIAGLPGCGKSLTAKAAAAKFKVPLIRLDMGRMMGKYVGESEANLRHAIQIADAISPCVLWVDELEKAFSGVGGQGSNAELTTRLMGNFLTWMQEKNSLSFVIATVNNISSIPAELLRKGRFDELFYVDLPNAIEREDILRIHIEKRYSKDLKEIDLESIAQDMDGYSGADIEGVVKDALEECYCRNKCNLCEDALRDAMSQSHPLEEIMKDEIEEMRTGYEKRRFKNASGE